MDSIEFRTVYKGTSITEADTAFSEKECFAIVYCESGYGISFVDAERAELTPGNAIALHSRGKSRGISLSDDFSGQFFLCEGTLTEALFFYYTEGRKFHLSPIGERTEKSLRFLEAATEDGDVYLFHTLLKIMRTEESHAAPKAGSTSVSAIKEYIDAHTERKITLEMLSKHFFISKTQIHRLFTAHYGISPMKYMLQTKVERSKELLVSTDMKIAEIADRLCFTDAKHYTKTFRNFTGMLPSEFRRKGV